MSADSDQGQTWMLELAYRQLQSMPGLPEGQNPIVVLIPSALIAHLLFNRLEPRSVPSVLCLLLAPPIALTFRFHASYNGIPQAILTCYSVYLTTLISSVIVYRLSPFHPLAGYPGPIASKITRFWAWHIARTGDQHRYYKGLHERYGTHVRIGPNHLSICDATAIPTILGPKGFRRGERYDIVKPRGTNGSLFTLRDPHEHARRRRIWDRSTNPNAVHGYIDILARRIEQLITVIEKQPGKTDLSWWISCFSFDFMGDLAFGGAFNLMKQEADPNGYMQKIRNRTEYTETMGTIPWIRWFQFLLPLAKSAHDFQEFSKNSILIRKAQGSAYKDIFYYLLDEEGTGSEPLSLPTLMLESGLVIVAGSDTTGTTLSNMFFYLISHPKAMARLQSEIDRTFPFGSESDVFNPAIVGEMPFLNAIINETLRLQPAVPSGVQRAFPPDMKGEIIAGRWVPAPTSVQVPTYSVHRDARYFSPEPDSFIPERWLEPQKGDCRLDRSAFFPFSYGPMNCAGKYLALQELRMTACSLLLKFNFEFSADWDPNEWEKGLLDNFVLVKGEMPVLAKAKK